MEEKLERLAAALRARDRPTGLALVRRQVQIFIEVCVLLGLVVGSELIAGDGRIGAFRVYPHPYWLVVLPMAAGRGLGSGLLAAALSSLLYVIGATQALHVDSIARLLSLDVMLEPILFFSVSFVVGELRDVVGERLLKYAKDLSESEEHSKRMREQRDVLKEANRILERRLVDQNSHFGTLVDIVSRTENASRSEILEVALELVQEQCGASASVLIPLVDGRVQPFSHRGWPESEAVERLKVTVESESVRRAMIEGREINGFSPTETPSRAGPLVVTPLTGGSGVIEALLCLEEVPTSILNSSTVRTFQAIGRWASAVLARIEKEPHASHAPDRAHMNEPSREWLGTTTDFARRLHYEYERSTRFGRPLSFLAIRITGEPDRIPPSVGEVDEFVIERFATRVRCSDHVYRFPHPGCYLLVLPATPEEGAQAVLKRLVTEESQAWSAPGRIQVHVTAPGPDAPDPQSLLTHLSQAFRAGGEMLTDGDQPLEIRAERRIGGLDEFRRGLYGELGLAMRGEYPMHVISVRAEKGDRVDPGLLAEDFLARAADKLREMDIVYSIGANHVAVVLPMIDAPGVDTVLDRIRSSLVTEDGPAPYGDISLKVLSFGPEYPFYGAFLEALADLRPLRETPLPGNAR